MIREQSDICDISDQQLYTQMCKHPSAVVLQSKVPTRSGFQKQFKYLYVPNQKYKLGEGSFGQVFICFFEGENKIVKLALKIIRIPQCYDQIKTIEHIVSTSRQQVLALIKLRQNKHIIRIEDILREKNMIFIVLEFCNERDLMHFFKKQKQLGRITKQLHVRYFFSQILDAFKELNKHNFMHRDIKPSNILVNNGVLKIADFGLSKQIYEGQSTSFQEQVGTMITAAPQIVFKEEYTNKCDIYSLGAILYWMIYDRFPFLKIPTRADFIENKLCFPEGDRFIVSPQMIKLLKQMLAYKQSERIDWIPLLQHELFLKNCFIDYQNQIRAHYEKIEKKKIRETYGRNITNLLVDDEFLDTAIPSAYYKFLKEIEGEDKFNRFKKQERNSILKDTAFIAHKNIKDEYRNQELRLKLSRTILMDIQNLQLKQLKQNKTQAFLMKDLLSYSIYKYMIYLMRKIKDQLTFVAPSSIFSMANLKEAEKQPLHQNFVKTVSQKLKGLEYMLRFSQQEIKQLDKKCEQFHLSGDLGVVFEEINEANFSNFMTVIDQCVIELVYFLKPELTKIINNSLISSDNFTKNTKEIVMVLHHLFMFSMQDQILPSKYDPEFEYSSFLENETDKKKIVAIQDKVIALVQRFQ